MAWGRPRLIACVIALIVIAFAIVTFLPHRHSRLVNVQPPAKREAAPAKRALPNLTGITPAGVAADEARRIGARKGAIPELAAWMKQWAADIQAGRQTSPDRIAKLDTILSSASLSFADALDLSETLSRMESQHVAQPAYHAMVAAAARELPSLRPDDPQAKFIADGLWSIYLPLHALADWKTGERMAMLLLPRDPPHPTHAFTAAYMHVPPGLNCHWRSNDNRVYRSAPYAKLSVLHDHLPIDFPLFGIRWSSAVQFSGA